MQLKTKIKLFGLVVALGILSVCLAYVFKGQIVDTLKLGVRISSFNIPRGVVLFDKSKIGEPFEITGVVRRRADLIKGAMVPRNTSYAPIEWEEFELIEGYPARFRLEITVPDQQELFFAQSINWHCSRMVDPILMRPALILIVAGQSNASGASEHVSVSVTDNVCYGDLGDKGINWRPAHDPGILHGKGSVWPLVGNTLQEKHGIAIGFINLAAGGTQLANWLPGEPFYERLISALNQTRASGLTAVLWAKARAITLFLQRTTNRDFAVSLINQGLRRVGMKFRG
jgi:hypothetical protein